MIVEQNTSDNEAISSQAAQDEPQVTGVRSRGTQPETPSTSHEGSRSTDSPLGKRTTASSRSTTLPKSHPLAQVTKSSNLELPKSYVSVLSSTPPASIQQPSIMINDDSSSTTLARGEINLDNPSAVWTHAMDLAGNGQVEEATKFFRIHETLSLAKKATMNAPSTAPSIGANISKDISLSNETQAAVVFSEGGLSFIPGAVTSHMDIGFTPYFDKNLRELKGPIPLTIFNRQWQDLANSYHVEKRVKVENLTKDITTYTGYPYPHEMTQSYATWNTNYRNFVRTLRDVYHFKRFAEWAEIHQANVEFYHTRDNWMTAFRYDIKIRLNAFAFRVSRNGTNAPPDISQRREDIAAICFAEARRLDEGSFEDNPYAKGGARFGYDWTTGLPRHSNSHSSSSFQGTSSNSFTTSSDQGSSTSNPNHFNQGFKRAHKQSSGGGKQRGGYQGNNFDPNHVAKKQTGSKSTPAPATT